MVYLVLIGFEIKGEFLFKLKSWFTIIFIMELEGNLRFEVLDICDGQIIYFDCCHQDDYTMNYSQNFIGLAEMVVFDFAVRLMQRFFSVS